MITLGVIANHARLGMSQCYVAISLYYSKCIVARLLHSCTKIYKFFSEIYNKIIIVIPWFSDKLIDLEWFILIYDKFMLVIHDLYSDLRFISWFIFWLVIYILIRDLYRDSKHPVRDSERCRTPWVKMTILIYGYFYPKNQLFLCIYI